METGLARLEQDFAPLLASRNDAAAVTYPGRRPFTSTRPIGLPLDFMVDAARDAGIEFDLKV